MHENSLRTQVFGWHNESRGHLGAAKAVDQTFPMLAKDPNWQKPSGYTWHHHEDGVTMQLIPSNIHGTGSGAMSPHMGGAALYGNGSQATAF